MAGCDVVDTHAPTGTNQTIVDGSGPAHYIYSDTTTFARDADVLAAGHRLENGPAVCWFGYQRKIHCEIGEHSFTTDGQFATFK